ncbi:MAG: SDH family Clp fold serine proteinase [Promethearchaeota archaeon]
MKTQEIIKKIEEKRNSKVITYFTSDRQGPVNARVAMDIIPIISNQLRKIGKTEKIDLILYSAGGDTMVPWRLVSMIREYCDYFSVLVPYKAHSAATMIALGADEIVMSDMSELSPIDPSTANVFNPADPKKPQNRIPISVEDVMAYFDLAKNKFGIKSDEELTKIFNKFIESNPSIHPLALGNVNRTHNLIRILAKRLLKSHKERIGDEEIEKIVDALTEKLYSHQYFIGRKEAKEDLGIDAVQFADKELADLMTEICEEYRREMKMNEIWNPEIELGENQAVNKKAYKIAYVESAESSNCFEVNLEFKKVQQTIAQQTPQGPINIPQEQIVWRIVGQGWR